MKTTEFAVRAEELNVLIESGSALKIAAAEIKAQALMEEIQGSEDIEKESRIAVAKVALGTAQAFLGKFNLAVLNLETALRKHLDFNALGLCDAIKALTMLNVARNKIDVIGNGDAVILISNFQDLKVAVKTGLGEDF